MGRHVAQAYRLPTHTGHIDTSTFSIPHDRRDLDGRRYSLLRFGKSKDQRPDRTCASSCKRGAHWTRLACRPGSELASLQQRVAAVLAHERVADHFQVQAEGR
ncbi:MAG: hypothetical protein JXM73_06020 [Anaerolineae bacterium]|nr:hypothetical protein [Anaerolineae bacterium]